MTIKLHQKKCVPCEGTEIALGPDKAAHYSTQVDDWSENDFIMAAKIDKLK